MVFILENFVEQLNKFPRCSSDEDIEKMRKPIREFLRFLLSPNTHIDHKCIIPLITNKTTIESLCFSLDINYYETILKVSKKNDFLKSICTYTPVLPIIDLQKCFQTNRYITSFTIDLCCSMLEVMNCSKQYRNNLDKVLKENINENYLCINPHVYFLSTYLSLETSRIMKSRINRNIQNAFKTNGIKINNTPKKSANGKYKMLILGKYDVVIPHSPIYKYIMNQLNTFNAMFELDFGILEADDPDNPNFKFAKTQTAFKNVFSLKLQLGNSDTFENFYDGKLQNKDKIFSNFDKILNNDYMFVYFPAMGDSIESIYLSNLEIAPYQFSSYGHPISSFGSKNNYFLCGKDVDRDNNLNYTEKLFFVDDIASQTMIPPKNTDPIEKDTEFYDITLSWNYKKVEPIMLENLKKIEEQADKKVRFNFFVGPSKVGGFPQCIEKLIKQTGIKNFIVHKPNLPFSKFLKAKGRSRLSLDSFPYGGFTTIFENLQMNIPIVVLDGDYTINRLPASICRKLGLKSLIANSYEDYVKRTVLLINNDEVYERVLGKIKKLNIEKTLKDTNYSKQIFDQMIKLVHNYEMEHSLQNNKKIKICIQGWRGLNHSYAIITRQLVQDLVDNGTEVYFQDVEYPIQYRNIWKREPDILMDRLPEPNGKVDMTIRISYPYNYEPSPFSKKLIVFGTSEFMYVNPQMYINRQLLDTKNTYLWCPSYYSREGFIRAGFDEKQIFVVSHAVDYTNFVEVDTKKRNKLRSKYNIDPDDTVLLHLGSGTGNKNIDSILEVFSHIRQKYPKTKLLLKLAFKLYQIGIENKLDKWGRDNIIYITDDFTTQQMNELYEISDVYLSPYMAEGFNLPVLEAMSHGVIPVMTKGGPTDEFCIPNVTFPIDSTFNIIRTYIINKRLYHDISLNPNKQSFLNQTVKAIDTCNNSLIHKPIKEQLKKHCRENFNSKLITNRVLQQISNIIG